MIDYRQVIENDFEKEIYVELHDRVISYLDNFGNTGFWQIVKNVGGSERRMIRLLNQMVLNNEIIYNDDSFSTKNSKHNMNCICDKCNGKRVVTDKINYIKNTLSKIWNDKPEPTFIFDQRPVNIQTTLNRVAYLLTNNDVYNKKILILGDDDLTSIAISLLRLPCEVVAVDVDKRLIEYINEVSKKYKLNLKAFEYNALEDIDKRHINYFDVLMTDPTPEKKPFNIFMNRAIDFTKSNGIIYTSIYSSAMAQTTSLQEIMIKMKLYITDIIPIFTEYQSIYELYSENDIKLFEKYNIIYDENSICFTESLIRMKKTSKTRKLKVAFKANDLFGKATKRVIKDDAADVKVRNEDKEYLDKVKSSLIENKDETLLSE